ncbi:BON domain-containing protein [Desulfoscipio gibsoniae]|uniref:Putative periplasmic or secreted lipoprotein n=1 Tax=Desulfoscipio gibsoniae DSM 7213 TaxID=767817 RepID=R4KIS2_9FIRM|nr:BON domain-containing protein [Desulfoscipio gibsoniae]AGL00445.1 putative periplasmic or secreted lipoprotein [Desulfoscipio gibsoniae DSM 7213]
MSDKPKDKDKALQHKVQQMLDSDKDLQGYALKANVIDGEVQVSGVVDALAEQNRLRERLAKMPGVKRVELGLAVSTDGAIDDSKVTAEVMEELEANPGVDLRHVGAKSVDGTVFLMGRVDTPEEEQEAIASASKARGVTRVVSQLKNRPGDRYDEESLEEIFHHQVNNDEEDGGVRIF